MASLTAVLTLTLAATTPRAPSGLEQCTAPLVPARPVTGEPGEQFLYRIELLGVDLGTVTVATTRRGSYEGRRVTEYRAWMKGDRIVEGLFGVGGDLAALVPEDGFAPVASRLAWRYRDDRFVETQTYGADGQITATRTKNGQKKVFERALPTPVLDILTAFNLVRGLPEEAHGCALMFTDGRAFTVWLEPQGKERLDLDGTELDSERYLVRYGSDKANAKVHRLDLWVSADRRLLRAQSHDKLSPVFSLMRGRG